MKQRYGLVLPLGSDSSTVYGPYRFPKEVASIPYLRPVKAGSLKAKSALIKLPLALITAADIANARDVVKRVREPKTPFLETVKAFQVLDVAAREGKPWEVEVQVITLATRWPGCPYRARSSLNLAWRSRRHRLFGTRKSPSWQTARSAIFQTSRPMRRETMKSLAPAAPKGRVKRLSRQRCDCSKTECHS
jgi:hypothetical protein